jgi:hypothetical protein
LAGDNPVVPPKEKSRLSAGLSCSRWSRPELTALTRILAALATRILLLLAGLLPAALLLAGFLTRVLILLTRLILVILVRHFRDLPC